MSGLTAKVHAERAREAEARRRLVPVDLSALAERDADPTHYAIHKILPRGHVTLLGSHGGAGKSVLAETFAAHVVTGTTWAGLPSTRGPSLVVSLEDSGNIARFRLRRICDECGLSHGEVAAGLAILDGSATDSVLAVEIADAGVRRLGFTEVLVEVEAAAAGRVLIVVDNASDAFGANENDRHLVRAFIRRLAQIARAHDCAVLLLAHIDKAAARFGANGNSYSGSTAWHNTVRSRLALIEDEAGPALVQEKLNLARKIDPIRLAWSDTGVLVPVAATGSEAIARDAQDDEAVLAAIQAATADGATIHAARSGPCTARTELAKYPDLPKALRRDAGRFWTALSRLERGGRIRRDDYITAHRNPRTRLIVCGEYPPIPPASPPQRVRGDAVVTAEQHHRRTAALPHCPRCDGAGCKWCRREQ